MVRRRRLRIFVGLSITSKRGSEKVNPRVFRGGRSCAKKSDYVFTTSCLAAAAAAGTRGLASSSQNRRVLVLPKLFRGTFRPSLQSDVQEVRLLSELLGFLLKTSSLENPW